MAWEDAMTVSSPPRENTSKPYELDSGGRGRGCGVTGGMGGEVGAKTSNYPHCRLRGRPSAPAATHARNKASKPNTQQAAPPTYVALEYTAAAWEVSAATKADLDKCKPNRRPHNTNTFCAPCDVHVSSLQHPR